MDKEQFIAAMEAAREPEDDLLATDNPLSIKIMALRRVAEDLKSSPISRVHYSGVGMSLVLDQVDSDVWELEQQLEKLRGENARRERHSGYGRGDSMG